MQAITINNALAKELVAETSHSATPVPDGFAEALTSFMADASTIGHPAAGSTKMTDEKGTQNAAASTSSDAKQSPADSGNPALALLVAAQVPIPALQMPIAIPNDTPAQAQALVPATDGAIEAQGNGVGFKSTAAATEASTQVKAKVSPPEVAQEMETGVNAKASLPELALPAEQAPPSPDSLLVKTNEKNVPAMPMPAAERTAPQADGRASEDPSPQLADVIELQAHAGSSGTVTTEPHHARYVAAAEGSVSNAAPEIVLSRLAQFAVASDVQNEKPQEAGAAQRSEPEATSPIPAGVEGSTCPVPGQTSVAVEAEPGTVDAPDRPQLIPSTARFAHLPPSNQTPPLTPAAESQTADIMVQPKRVHPPARSGDATGMAASPGAQPSAEDPAPQHPFQAARVPVPVHRPDALPETAVQIKEAVAAAATSDKKIARIDAPPSNAAPSTEVAAGQKTAHTAPAADSNPDSQDNSPRKLVDPACANLPAREVPVASAPTNDFAPAVAVPKDAPPAAGHAAPPVTRDFPQTHQMLDSVPALPAQPLSPHGADSVLDTQMRVGVRTTAFGAVEIYTAVHQNQVGLTVHGGRDLTQWFSSEVPSIESGLRDHHLNLTTVELGSHGTGLQTATGSHHQDAPRSFMAVPRSWNSDMAEPTNEMDLAGATPTAPEGLEKNYVSIRI